MGTSRARGVADLGIMITASHNPFYDNGIKFFNKFGRKISEELEAEIEKRLNDPIQPVEASDLGKAFRIDSAAGRYIEYCKSTLKGAHNLKDKTILVDGANGANYKVTPMLLQELGAKVIKVNCDPDGFNINEKSAVLNQNLFKDYAKTYKINRKKAIQPYIEVVEFLKKIPNFKPGDIVTVHVKIIEKKRERTQAFEGVCIAKKNAGINSSFTIRKISYGEGVERVFPLYSPNVAKIEVDGINKN